MRGFQLTDLRDRGLVLKALNLPRPDEDDPRREHAWKTIDRLRAGYAGRIAGIIRGGLVNQRAQVLKAARQAGSRFGVQLAVENELARSDHHYETAVRRAVTVVYVAFATRTLDSLEGKARPHVWYVPKELPLWQWAKTPTAKQVPGAPADDLWARRADAYVTQHAGALIEAPNETTHAGLRDTTRKVVRAGIREGWSIQRMTNEIEARTGDLVNRVRARRIARTETIRASNAASLEAAGESGLRLRKEWLATFDDRVRSSHLANDGVTKGMNQPFDVGGFSAQYPAAPSLPPHLSINCRCTLAYLTEDEFE